MKTLEVSGRRDDTRDRAVETHAALQIADSLMNAPGGISGSTAEETECLHRAARLIFDARMALAEFVGLRDGTVGRFF